MGDYTKFAAYQGICIPFQACNSLLISLFRNKFLNSPLNPWSLISSINDHHYVDSKARPCTRHDPLDSVLMSLGDDRLRSSWRSGIRMSIVGRRLRTFWIGDRLLLGLGLFGEVVWILDLLGEDCCKGNWRGENVGWNERIDMRGIGGLFKVKLRLF